MPTGTPPDPCLPYSLVNWTDDYKRELLDLPVQSYETVPASCTDLLKNKKANTDVLVVRHAETCLPGAPNCEADIAGNLYFQSSLCGTQKPSSFDLSTAGFGNDAEEGLHDAFAQAQARCRHLLRARLRRHRG